MGEPKKRKTISIINIVFTIYLVIKMNNHYEAIIIGGGMAGAYLAHHMHQQNINFCLLEASYKLGGRHQTIKKGCDVLYDSGAWRVHSSHKRLIKLCKYFQNFTKY